MGTKGKVSCCGVGDKDIEIYASLGTCETGCESHRTGGLWDLWKKWGDVGVAAVPGAMVGRVCAFAEFPEAGGTEGERGGSVVRLLSSESSFSALSLAFPNGPVAHCRI
jgi:hypothetical protein